MVDTHDSNDWLDRYSVSCDSRDTLATLKEKIAQHLALDPDLIHLRRGRSAGMLKDEQKTLRAMSFGDGTTVFVAPGPVIKKGHYVIRFEQYITQSHPDQSDEQSDATTQTLGSPSESAPANVEGDNTGNAGSKPAVKAPTNKKVRHRFKHLFDMPLSELKKIRQVRRMLGDRLNHPWDQIRVREVKHGYIGTFYRDEQTLRACLKRLNDSVSLAVELLDHSEKLTKFHKMVLCRRVRPGYPRVPKKKTVIEPSTHIIVNKTFTIGL